MPSFDLVSSLDMGELKNVLNMAQKQISGRYDFKGSKCSIELKNDKELEVIAETEMRLEAAMSIFYSCMSKRGLGLKCLDVQKVEPTGHQMNKQIIVLNSGISKENGKIINKLIKESGCKVQSQYLDEKIRVTSKKIDELQKTFQMLKNHDDLKIDVMMENMK
jgi:uncharacterized protein YajQ (UPF0234 family)